MHIDYDSKIKTGVSRSQTNPSLDRGGRYEVPLVTKELLAMVADGRGRLFFVYEFR